MAHHTALVGPSAVAIITVGLDATPGGVIVDPSAAAYHAHFVERSSTRTAIVCHSASQSLSLWWFPAAAAIVCHTASQSLSFWWFPAAAAAATTGWQQLQLHRPRRP